MRRLNYVHSYSGYNQPHTVIRSSSIESNLLTEVASALQTHDGWGMYSASEISDIEECSPEPLSLKHARVTNPGGGIGSGIAHWSEAPFEGPVLRFHTDEPEHIRFFPTTQLDPLDGAWAVDVTIERQENLSGILNVHHHWDIPRRLRLSGSFIQPYEIEPHMGSFVFARANASGNLVVYSSKTKRDLEITVPDDTQAFKTALTKGRNWPPFSSKPEFDSRNILQACTYLESSTQGRFFEGTLGLFGGYAPACDVVLNSLWSGLFDGIGATSKNTLQRKEELGEKVEKRLPEIISLKDDNQKNILLNLIIQEAQSQRVYNNHWRWDKITNAFEVRHKEHYDHAIRPHITEDHSYSYEDEMQNDLKRFEKHVQELCSKRVLFQGFHRRCPTCFHREWISISDLRAENPCNVCGYKILAPVHQLWDFMLNPFLVKALRDHAVQSLLWTLNRVQNTFSNSFYFLGPTNIWLDRYPDEVGGPDGDIDLLVVSDRSVIACEVKQSARDLDTQNFEKIVHRIRPDIAVLAVMEPLNSRISGALKRLSDNLVPSGIRVQSITLEESDLESRPTFDLKRVRVL